VSVEATLDPQNIAIDAVDMLRVPQIPFGRRVVTIYGSALLSQRKIRHSHGHGNSADSFSLITHCPSEAMITDLADNAQKMSGICLQAPGKKRNKE
jgi:hypothetical protein